MCIYFSGSIAVKMTEEVEKMSGEVSPPVNSEQLLLDLRQLVEIYNTYKASDSIKILLALNQFVTLFEQLDEYLVVTGDVPAEWLGGWRH